MDGESRGNGRGLSDNGRGLQVLGEDQVVYYRFSERKKKIKIQKRMKRRKMLTRFIVVYTSVPVVAIIKMVIIIKK